MRPIMRWLGIVFLLFQLFSCVLAQEIRSSKVVQASTVFRKLLSLVGNWQEEGKSSPIQTNFKSMVSDTAVMETLTMPGMDDMVTLYSVDGNAIALLHYCPTNNQPRMRAIPASSDPKELVFEFQGAGNLPSLSMGHEQKLVITFEDKDHIVERWTWQKQGKDTDSVYHFTRQMK